MGFRVGAEADLEGSCTEAESKLAAGMSVYKQGSSYDDFVFKRLLTEENITKGTPTSQDILSKYDNLNYFGTQGALEMLQVALDRSKNADNMNSWKLVDVGAGYGGTARFLVKHLGGDSSAHAIELRESTHLAANSLSSMASAAGDFPEGAVHHVRANVVTGAPLDGSMPAPQSIDLMVSRLALYHMGDEEARNSMWSNVASWMKPGGSIAVEDFTKEEGGLTEEAADVVTNKLAGGWVCTNAEYKAMLEKNGFKDVVVEDLTSRTAEFVNKRRKGADASAKSYDEKYGEEAGKELREFFADVDYLFNPPEGQKTGWLFVRVYATKA